ncbi:MAG: hypothetical protein MR671_04740 [Clostridiales bacterium]|nr:hypothetical protein [Clostridiales bacterium]
MGGRGARSGSYIWRGKKHTYGDEYKTIYQYRNIKYLAIKEGSATAPLETQTQGRVYVTLGSNGKPRYITYYTGAGNKKKEIDLEGPSHSVNGERIKPPHTHNGNKHSEHATHKPTKREQKMIDFVLEKWENRFGKD